MPQQSQGYHYHYYTRRRKLREEYNLFSSIYRKHIDKIVYLVIALGLVMTIPQVTKIWVEQNASGVSILTWSTYIITSAFWLTYGIYHRVRPIIISSGGWVALHILVVIGTALYG